MQIPIETLNLLMLNVGLAQHHGDWNWQGVSSPFTRIYYVTEGEAWLHLPEGSVPLRAGYMYIVPAYTVHSYECKGQFAHYYLHIYEGFKNETNVFDTYTFPTEVKAEAGDEELFAGMCRAYPEAKLPQSDPESYNNYKKFTDDVRRYRNMQLWEKMRLRGAILILFSRFMQKATPCLWTRDERMARVLTYVHSHLYEDISIDTLANVACVTKPYLIRLFKRDFGVSPLQFINKKKVERSQLLLITDNMAVKEIAYTLGFNDHSYFIRLFKKITGTTPQEYRHRML